MTSPHRSLSFLDVVAQYSSFPQPDPAARLSPLAASNVPEEEDLGQLVDNADPAQSHLDPEYSYSYLHLSLKECRALVAQFRAADPENNGLTLDQFSKVTGTFLASKTTSDPAAIFAMFDTAASSRVTLREFLCGYAILCKGTTDTRIRYIFNMFDTKDEGVLNKAQLTAALKLIEAYARSAETASSAQNAVPESSVSCAVGVPRGEPIVDDIVDSYEAIDVDREGNGDQSDGPDPESLVDDIVDSLLAGEEQISYDEFISMCKEEENVLLWLELLAKGTGEFLDESVRAASERHVVELSMQRARVIAVGSPPQMTRALSSGGLPASDRSNLSPGPDFPNASSLPCHDAGSARDVTWSPKSSMTAVESSPSTAAAPVVVRRSFERKGFPENSGDTVKQPFIIDFKQIKFDKVIGRGACATVWAGEWLHMPVAVKVFKEDDEALGNTGTENAHGGSIDTKLVGDLIDEAAVLMQVRHPNVCLFLCLCIEPKVCVVSELYLGGSVHDYLHKATRNRFGSKQALALIADVARGMTYLHFSDPVILHRDLKTRNILIDRGVTHCVICDFGVSRLQEQTAGQLSGRGSMVGSVNTMAPEVMEGKPYTRASDVYSFAMVAYEMFTGCIPFKSMRAIQLMFMVTEGERPKIDETFVPHELSQLLKHCWSQDPASRPDFDTIMTILDGEALRSEVDALEEVASGSDEKGPENIVADLSKMLIDVAYAGRIEDANRLLSRGADVHYADYDSRTALHIACAEGHEEVVRVLLKAGAKPESKDRWGGTALTDALRNGHDSIVAHLRAVSPDLEPSGADFLPLPAVQQVGDARATRFGTPHVVEMEKVLQFMVAVHAGDIDKCRVLLASGYAVNAADYDGRTPCHLAVSQGDIAIVSLLLEHSCDTALPDRWGSTPLDEAIRLDRSELVVLIEVAQAKQRLKRVI